MSAPKLLARPPQVCLNCGRNLRDRKRRCARTALCRKCVSKPKIWAKFRLGFSPPRSPASMPTKAPPGSEAKLRLLARRLRWSQALHHPDDHSLPLPDPDDPDQWRMIEAAMVMTLVRGVYLDKDGPRARAYPYCPKRKRRVHLGYFPTRAEAAAAIVEWVNAGRPSR